MTYQTRRVRPSAKRYFALVIPDVHVGYVVDTPTHSHGCWDIGIQAIEHYGDRLTHIVILGDFGNWESLSRWSALRAEQAFIEEDVALVNARLDEIEALTKRHSIDVAFTEGNHENWAAQFEAKYPALRDTINLKSRLRFEERGWTWVSENRFYALGDLHFTHGHAYGMRKPIDWVLKKGVSVACGHWHRYETESVRQVDAERAAWTLGCWAALDPPPPYARGDTPNWVHGFGLAQVRSNGRFQLAYRRILDESWTELDDGTELIARPAEIRKRLKEEADIRKALRTVYGERFYVPGGPVVRPEPLQGTEHVTRQRRARRTTGKTRAVK